MLPGDACRVVALRLMTPPSSPCMRSRMSVRVWSLEASPSSGSDSSPSSRSDGTLTSPSSRDREKHIYIRSRLTLCLFVVLGFSPNVYKVSIGSCLLALSSIYMVFWTMFLLVLASFMYLSNTRLDHLPVVIISWSSKPACPSMVAMPIRNEWVAKNPMDLSV